MKTLRNISIITALFLGAVEPETLSGIAILGAIIISLLLVAIAVDTDKQTLK